MTNQREPATVEETPMHQETIAVRAGRGDNARALAPILWATSAFTTESLDDARARATSARPGHFYSRYSNPTVRGFEDAIAELEGAEAALAFASGSGAIASVVLALCSKGDHIVAQRQLYGGTSVFLQSVCPRFGIDVTFVDGTEQGAFAAAVKPGKTMLVFAETPANPRLDLVDLAELGALRGPITVVDSTFATPVLQRPLEHGVQLVVHSATKGIAGHNDATLGVVAGAQDLIEAIWAYSVLHGACASPFDALNGLRGIRTLSVRVERQCASALELAGHLERHSAISSVSYPGLASHPQRALAASQMRAGGTMIAVDLAGGIEAGRAFVEGVRVAQLAASLGGPETLVIHPATSTHAGLSPSERLAAGVTDGLVRISVGLEHPSDLAADFDQALKRCC